MPTLTFKVSAAEARTIRARARAAKANVSTYLRTSALGGTHDRKNPQVSPAQTPCFWPALRCLRGKITRRHERDRARLIGRFPVKYLLNVTALIAWAHVNAASHTAFHHWAKSRGFKTLTTCAQVELGFIRVSMQGFGYSRERAETALAEMKRHTGGFISFALSPQQPAWAKSTAHTSDAYLAQLAATAGLTLATFDLGIPAPAERTA